MGHDERQAGLSSTWDCAGEYSPAGLQRFDTL
jgi:hypothetical protein